jgi:hypothetical protein
MKKEIEQEVEEALAQGQTHQEIFTSLSEKYFKQGKLLTEVLCKTPIPARKKKFKAVWIILLFILGILLALRSMNMIFLESGFDKFINGFFAAILAYVIYSVAKYEKYTFQFLGVLGIVNTLWIVRISHKAYGGVSPDALISLVLVVGMCVCSYILYFQLFVKHAIKKVVVQGANGKNRVEVHATFEKRQAL